MKQPTACQNLADIRTEIDRIDKQIVELIGQRALYVQKAAAFKQDLAAVNYHHQRWWLVDHPERVSQGIPSGGV